MPPSAGRLPQRNAKSTEFRNVFTNDFLNACADDSDRYNAGRRMPTRTSERSAELVAPAVVEPPVSPSFEAETQNVFAVVRKAFGELLGAMPTPIRRPADLQRALRLDYKLSW